MTTIDFHSKSVSQSSSVSRGVDLKIKFSEGIGSNPGLYSIFFSFLTDFSYVKLYTKLTFMPVLCSFDTFINHKVDSSMYSVCNRNQ